MPPEFTSALGRLLTEAPLRSEFRRDPLRTADQFGLVDDDREAIAALDPRDLDRQAEALIVKRFHEVGKRMPRTFQALGPDVRRLFRVYAERQWPEGQERHLKDAVAFGESILRIRVKGICRSELSRLRFELEGGRWAVRWVPDALIDGRARSALQILWRKGSGEVRAAAIGIGLPRFGPSKGDPPA